MESLNYDGFNPSAYHNPMDTDQYINFKSCHRPHFKKSISYSRALRLRRICDSDYIFKIRVKVYMKLNLSLSYLKELLK